MRTAKNRVTEPRNGALRVWHIPQVPGKQFYVEVLSVEAGIVILDILAKYDQFQFDHRIKPDYANAQGLQVFEEGEWAEWYDEDGNDIGELRRIR